MALFTALIATSFTVGGLITREIAPEALTFLRFLIAAGVGGPLLTGIAVTAAAVAVIESARREFRVSSNCRC